MAIQEFFVIHFKYIKHGKHLKKQQCRGFPYRLDRKLEHFNLQKVKPFILRCTQEILSLFCYSVDNCTLVIFVHFPLTGSSLVQFSSTHFFFFFFISDAKIWYLVPRLSKFQAT